MRAEGCALVTGASRGIGRGVAIELAARGFDVVATVRRPDQALALEDEAAARGGGRLRVARLDVLRPDDFSVPEGLKVVVNNAGADGPWLPVEHQPLDDWRALFETNVFGLVRICQRTIPALRAAGGGVLCNLTSCSILAPMPFFAAYRASKAAVSAVGESLRAELAPFGIRVLEILPGAIATDMLAATDRAPEALAFDDYAALAEKVRVARGAAIQSPTPVTAAARRIADAILDDDVPLRVACDPMGEALLAAWRAHDDETAQAGMLAAFRRD